MADVVIFRKFNAGKLENETAAFFVTIPGEKPNTCLTYIQEHKGLSKRPTGKLIELELNYKFALKRSTEPSKQAKESLRFLLEQAGFELTIRRNAKLGRKTVDPQRKEKKCSLCEETKDRKEFSIAKRSPDGLNPLCRDCLRIENMIKQLAPTGSGVRDLKISMEDLKRRMLAMELRMEGFTIRQVSRVLAKTVTPEEVLLEREKHSAACTKRKQELLKKYGNYLDKDKRDEYKQVLRHHAEQEAIRKKERAKKREADRLNKEKRRKAKEASEAKRLQQLRDGITCEVCGFVDKECGSQCPVCNTEY